MPTKNLFDKPFDEGTIDKLEIFRDYFKAWLPVFIAKPDPYWKTIQIFDYFAGQGKDVNGIHGSPLIIISILNENRTLLLRSCVKIKVVLNEYDQQLFESLKKNVEALAQRDIYDVEYFNHDFIFAFDQYYNSMLDTANFMFLDQNGIKQITERVFQQIIKLRQTDFIFFISSSYISRFAPLEAFQKYLQISKQDLLNKSYYHIHRIVLEYYRNLIPSEKKYYLAPFSIKKPTGIYGLIFGTNHTYGLEKFLNVCWKHDVLTGEANFDIDNEKININTPTLFEQFNVPTKRQVFEKKLRETILNGELKTNIEVYIAAMNEGFLPKDANLILKALKEENKIIYDFKLANSKIHNEPVANFNIL